MQKELYLKLGMIAGLTVLLLIPLQLVRDVVYDRQAYREQALRSIQESWTGRQALIGPILAVPYIETATRKVWDKERQEYRMDEQRTAATLLISPATLETTGRIATERRKRGLYEIPVYTASIRLRGRFDNRKLLELMTNTENEITWKRPFLTVMISDLRGVVSQPKLRWGERLLEFQAGSPLPGTGQAIQATLEGLASDERAAYPFEMDLDLRGTAGLEFAPIGGETRVSLTSDWAHPSFVGRYLPAEHEVTSEGFQARWMASAFSSDMGKALAACALGKCQLLQSSIFGVALIDPIDIYVQAERSIKYGILFLALTFTLFFLYEVLKSARLHAVQYLLVGLALTIFFLLLVALSEVLSFGTAYAAAATACTLLLGSYVSGVLRSARSGVAFAAVYALLYAALYGILRSEDNALLMGSLLLFCVLGAVMLATRRMDWYAIGEGLSADPPERITPRG